MKDHWIESPLHILWLVVGNDNQLNFKPHEQEWTGKAKLLRYINGAQRGTAPGPLIRAVQACVLSTALHGAEAWWPGLTRINTLQDKEYGTEVGWHISLMEKTILKAIRAALPAWCTTLKIALDHEAEISPASIILQQKMLGQEASNDG